MRNKKVLTLVLKVLKTGKRLHGTAINLSHTWSLNFLCARFSAFPFASRKVSV